MPPSCPNNEKGSSSSSSSSNEDSNNKKSSSWFASWFENDSSNLKQEIHQKLNEFDDYQHRHKTSHPLVGHGGTIPAAVAAAAAGHQQPMSLQQEMEEFFESAGLGGIANHPPLWTTSSSSSSSSSSFRGHQGGGHYQMMRKEDQNGVQIDVQFPRAIEAETVAVEVLQESPCVVQWRNAPNGKNAREFRDRARLGDSIDCSQLSATISSVQTNMLTVKAPRYTSSGVGQAKPRVVPVTERDD